MKKSVCLLVAVVLLMGTAVALAAEKPLLAQPWAFDSSIDAMVYTGEIPPLECVHSYRVFRDAASTACVPLDGVYHEERAYLATLCDKCGDAAVLFQPLGRAAHHMTPNGDEHAADGHLHTYHERCTECGYTGSITIGCPGTGRGDCPPPFSAAETAP